MHTPHLALSGLVMAAILACLSGCGGGSEPVLNFESKAITVTGTAATSTSANTATTALAAIPVTLDCRNGHATAMTDANGNYTMTVTGLSQGPCVVTATLPSGATSTLLRSLAADNGSVANITPLTEMLVQYVSAQVGLPATQSQPATNLASSNKLQTLAKAGGLATSSASVASVIMANTVAPAVNVPTDFLTGQLQAKVQGNAGNAQSLVLEQLRTKSLTTVAGQSAATVIAATGQPSAQILLRLDAVAKANLVQ